VYVVAVGICGTRVDIFEGRYGWAPSGWDGLLLGYEALGRVLDLGPSSGLKARRPGCQHRVRPARGGRQVQGLR